MPWPGRARGTRLRWERGARVSARHTSALEALCVDEGFDADVRLDEPMARHTAYRLGGPARYFACAHSLGSLKRLIGAAVSCGVPWMVVGRGSNLLVADEGFPGLVCTLGRDFRAVRYSDEQRAILAGGAALLQAVVQEAFRRCLAGMEFAVDIPGTVGGSLAMNAGTANGCMADVVAAATVLDADGRLRRLPAEDMAWGYRQGPFAADQVVVECELSVKQGEPFAIRGKMEAAHARRTKTQPLGCPSCGSVFRNPEGESAGSLVERAGLKGYTVGGAQVSPEHGNFIVNTGTATASDVKCVMDHVQAKVYEAYGIQLIPEVRTVGFAS